MEAEAAKIFFTKREAEAEAMKFFFSKIEVEAEAPSRSTASKTLVSPVSVRLYVRTSVRPYLR